MATSVTGDLKDHKDVQKKGVTLHNMPVYPLAELSAVGSVLNDRVVSGKRVGALVTAVVSGSPVLFQAAGEAPADKWVAVTKGATDVTPA
ncbi:hypothetical protein [Pseudomonas phage Nerthus]|uniref:Uncharacterized protein n=1 Tax=Pseudomonas phage Nerthus TaxID=2163984 RepID=A0A2S1GMU8_9CAUD|nr:acetyl-CoA acetyltransferase [Pseudomonas phage Nerthus]AWD90673.1 hypothetical protein [Pseudomonas phage Nerthus]